MDLEIHTAAQKKLHTLFLQQATLRLRVTDVEVRAAGATTLDHTMAGNARAVGVVVHGPADDPRRSGCTKHAGNLAVRRHSSVGDAGHQRIHPVEESLLSSRGLVAWLFPFARPALQHSHDLPAPPDLFELSFPNNLVSARDFQ
jgi:hypothetical protein